MNLLDDVLAVMDKHLETSNKHTDRNSLGKLKHCKFWRIEILASLRLNSGKNWKIRNWKVELRIHWSWFLSHMVHMICMPIFTPFENWTKNAYEMRHVINSFKCFTWQKSYLLEIYGLWKWPVLIKYPVQIGFDSTENDRILWPYILSYGL